MEGHTLTFSDPDSYGAAFGDARIQLTITGAGEFKAKLTRLKLNHLEVCRCSESLGRIAYISFPFSRIFLSFPVGPASLTSAGSALQNGDMVLHGRGERVHQWSNAGCEWGLILLSPEQLAGLSKALTGKPIASPPASRIIRPSRADASRFKGLFRQACQLADTKKTLAQSSESARALEHEMLHAIIQCLTAKEVDDHSRARRQHAAVMVRFEEGLEKRVYQRLSVPALCEEIGVAERTLRMCCTELVGVSPTRYVLLQRLNKARAALRRADPSKASVTQVARNYQFLELGRFAVAYRTTFGESPSTTLQRSAQI